MVLVKLTHVLIIIEPRIVSFTFNVIVRDFLKFSKNSKKKSPSTTAVEKT